MRVTHDIKTTIPASLVVMGNWLSWCSRRDTQRLSWDELAQEIASSKKICALTGAGVSKESGVPTFRDSSDGIYANHSVMDVATIWGFKRKPEAIWDMIRDVSLRIDPKPNPSHDALVELEKMGKLDTVVTQNIDNLHQEAGNSNVVEFHGNIRDAVCLKCGYKEPVPREKMREAGFYPTCYKCDMILKPMAVLFGEGIPSNASAAATKAVSQCDLLLVVGTSAAVSPANGLPYTAARHGAKVVEVNLEPTGLTGRISDGIVQGPASRLLMCVETSKRLKPAASVFLKK